MSNWRIPLFDTRFGPEEEAAVLRPLRAGWLTMGEEVLRLEEELCALTGARHAIAVSNCTVALHLASAALDLLPGDEVICPTLTFVATANAPRSAGLTVRLCDSVDENDLTIDPESIARRLGQRTRAIFITHFAGFACDIRKILALAEQHSIPVIEDCAHALFTTHQGKTLGLHGRVGCFSFFSNKNATCGEGGALITDDAALAEKLRLLRSHGMTTLTLDRHRGAAVSYDVLCAGFNYRLDEIRAALLRVQLRRLPAFLARRRELFARYAELLRGLPVRVPFTKGRFTDELPDTGVHLLTILLPPKVDRLGVIARLKEKGIQTSIHYPPVHSFTAYQGMENDLHRTEALAARELTLPFFPAMRDEDVTSVVRVLESSLQH